jgi:hypothetical protein
MTTKHYPVLASLLLLTLALVATANAQDDHDNDRNHIRHVLLVSIDGMHAVDYLNCSQGVPSINCDRGFGVLCDATIRHGFQPDFSPIGPVSQE